ncbi:hypothetical protein CC78DRAFT_548761 [Lojkania enalia]|uniref:Zn(2)-C6 fungal-type domain-containing protein n=1 Tax=Lojkania enalia TaxID=147567 RepID=A0A9P4N509_9PLEO|nr:hypothetical protein CC78DRAFT_548761 [Didymosphaeria enalia]
MKVLKRKPMSFSYASKNSVTKIRDACNRCHFKKLKCERTATGCLRCDQANLACVSGPRRPYDITNRVRGQRQVRTLQTSEASPSSSLSQSVDHLVEDWSIDGFDLSNPVSNLTPAEHSSFSFPRPEVETLWSRDIVPGEETISVASNILWPTDPANPTMSASVQGLGTKQALPLDQTLVETASGSESQSVNLVSAIADTALHIFQPNELDSLRLLPQPRRPSAKEAPRGSLDLYTHTFNASQALAKVVHLTKDSCCGHEQSGSLPIDDADLVLTLSCFLKLLSRYDTIFRLWLDVIDHSMVYHDDTLPSLALSSLRGDMMRLLPPVTIGLYAAPHFHFSQIQLTLDVSTNMMGELGEALEILATNVTGRNRRANVNVLTHVGDTTIELVMEKMRAVVGRKETVMKKMEDTAVKQRIEALFLVPGT